MENAMSRRPMSLKRWRELREEIYGRIEDALAVVRELDDCTFSDKDNATQAARDAVLKSLYERDAIHPPRGIEPS
jgi:hypothetical protein